MIATLIFLSSLFLTIGGGTTTVQESYDILVNLTIVVYFVPYVYLFLGASRASRRRESDDRRCGSPWRRASLATVVSMVLVLVPPAGTPTSSTTKPT